MAGAFTVEATAGFGATVIAVTLGAHLFPLGVLLPVIVPVGVVLSGTIAWRQRARADRRLMLLGILPLMGAGLVAGLLLFQRASNESLRRAYGVFVVCVAALELWRLHRPQAVIRPLPRPVAAGALLGAGVIHGLFSSGGPLLVYALGRLGIEKSTFRATLSGVWVTLGLALTTAYTATGRIDGASLAATAALLPVLGVSLVAGEWAHRRLDETRFRKVVYALLVVAGLSNAL